MAKTKKFIGPRMNNPYSGYSRRSVNTSSNVIRPVGSKLTGEWRPQYRKAFFNGGSALDWMHFKPKLEAAFVENECFHYVKLEEATSSTSSSSSSSSSSSTSIANVAENRFTDAEPTEVEMVDNEIAKQLERMNLCFDEMVQRLEGLGPGGAQQAAPELLMEIAKVENQRSMKFCEIQNTAHSLRDKFVTATKDWRSQKEQHIKTVGKCMNVFNTCLGDSAKAVIKDNLPI